MTNDNNVDTRDAWFESWLYVQCRLSRLTALNDHVSDICYFLILQRLFRYRDCLLWHRDEISELLLLVWVRAGLAQPV